MLYTASEVWCLGRYLSLLIGDLIPEDDEIWCNFLRLLEIIDIMFAPQCSDATVAFLGHITELYLQTFVKVHPDDSVIPKMHYLVHYPAMIVR